MKSALCCSIAVLLVAAVSAETREHTLSPSEKGRIEQTLREIRDSEGITHHQYQESIAILNDSQCETINRTFTDAEKSRWSRDISKRKHSLGAEAVQSFRSGQWRVVYVTYPNAEPAYHFHDSSRSVTVWGGAATIFDAPDIKRWIREQAPGIPQRLAHCFAWHVTYDRDM